MGAYYRWIPTLSPLAITIRRDRRLPLNGQYFLKKQDITFTRIKGGPSLVRGRACAPPDTSTTESSSCTLCTYELDAQKDVGFTKTGVMECKKPGAIEPSQPRAFS